MEFGFKQNLSVCVWVSDQNPQSSLRGQRCVLVQYACTCIGTLHTNRSERMDKVLLTVALRA